MFRHRVAVTALEPDRGLLLSRSVGSFVPFELDFDWSGLSCDFVVDGGRNCVSLPYRSGPVELGHQILQRSIVSLDRVAVTWAHVAEATAGGTFTQTPLV